MEVRIKGEKPRTRAFKRKTDAELWAKKVEGDLGHGAYVHIKADRRHTLADLIHKFRRERLALRGAGTGARNVESQLAPSESAPGARRRIHRIVGDSMRDARRPSFVCRQGLTDAARFWNISKQSAQQQLESLVQYGVAYSEQGGYFASLIGEPQKCDRSSRRRS